MKSSIFKYYTWFVIGLWIAIGFSAFIQFKNDGSHILESFLSTLSLMIAAISISSFLSMRLFPKALHAENKRVFSLQFVLLTLLLAILFATTIKGFVWLEKQGVFLPTSIFSEQESPFYIEVLANIVSAFGINFIFCAIRYFPEHYKIAQEHARLKQAYLENQLHLLRNQISPHLIFNVLNHIHILMKKDTNMADELLLRYSDVLRYQLYDCNKEIVLLEKEVEYLEDVIEVEKMRWGNELKVNWTLDIEEGKKEISPLLLIPFIENAFKHVSRLPSKKGYVNISLDQKGNILRLVVENSKANQVTSQRNTSGLGLGNVKKQLNILYPEKHELVIQQTDTTYKTTLIITL